MRTSWLRVALLVIAVVVGHDLYMATTGYAVMAAAGAPTAGQDDRHHQDHHGNHDPSRIATQDGTEPAGSTTSHCEPLRVAAPANRNMSPSFDTMPSALIPEPAMLTRFASTSRTIVETPLPHPPDLDRAFFQVYRI